MMCMKYDYPLVDDKVTLANARTKSEKIAKLNIRFCILSRPDICNKPGMSTLQQPEVICRLISEHDFDEVVACLRRGFPERPQRYWESALEWMSRRPAIANHPRFGRALLVGRNVVGVILMIVSRDDQADGEAIRCNLSSWCVDEAYRRHAARLYMLCIRNNELTYTNISPAPYTRRMVEASGFRRFSNGLFVFAPVLSNPRLRVRTIQFDANSPEAALLPENERSILTEHAELGCRSLICVSEGAAHPFVVQDRTLFRGLIPCSQLIYCRGMDELVRFAGAIGRHLLLRARPLCIADATGPVAGLAGRYFSERGPKYYKGPVPPRLGDLSYTELAVLGP